MNKDDDDIITTNRIGVDDHTVVTNHLLEGEPLSLLSSSDIRKKCKLGYLIVVWGTHCSKHQPRE